MSNSKVIVKINGAEYPLIGDESEEYLFSIAHYVDKKVKEILRTNIKHSNTSAAVLTAVTLADELFKGRREIEFLKKALQEPEEKLKMLQFDYQKLEEKNNILTKTNEEFKTKNAEVSKDLTTLKENYDKLYENYSKVTSDFEKLLNEFSAIKEQSNDLKQENVALKENNSKLKDELLDKEIEFTKINKDLKDFQNKRKLRV